MLHIGFFRGAFLLEFEVESLVFLPSFAVSTASFVDPCLTAALFTDPLMAVAVLSSPLVSSGTDELTKKERFTGCESKSEQRWAAEPRACSRVAS
jgi:hypothetical protein